MSVSNGPLAGKRVLITRPREQADDFARRLEALGAVPVALPAIRLASPADWGPLDAAAARLSAYDWVVFTSANGVRFVAERLRELGKAHPVFQTNRVAAIGPATAEALRALEERVDFVPARYVAEAIAEELGTVAGQRFLLLRADIARPALREQLRARGAEVVEVSAYRTQTEPLDRADIDARLRDGVDAVTFTSASTVRGLADALGGELAPLRDCLIAAIGPVTAQAAAAAGLPPDVVAREHTVPGLIHALQEVFTHDTTA